MPLKTVAKAQGRMTCRSHVSKYYIVKQINTTEYLILAKIDDWGKAAVLVHHASTKPFGRPKGW